MGCRCKLPDGLLLLLPRVTDKTVMSRLVALLLIPLCLLGQPMPHSHAGSRSDEPGDHSSRPHVHLGHHHSHSHSRGHQHHHEDESPAETSVFAGTDHDGDAIYLGDFRASGSLKTVSAPSAMLFIAAIWHSWMPAAPAITVCRYIAAPPDSSAGMPVYLQATSLRI